MSNKITVNRSDLATLLSVFEEFPNQSEHDQEDLNKHRAITSRIKRALGEAPTTQAEHAASKRFLSVCIFKTNFGDCTNKGISSRTDDPIFVIPCARGNWSQEDIDRNPAKFQVFQFNEAVHNGRRANYGPVNETRWTMFGGNFLWTSDSRFSEMHDSPVHIHDRIE